MPEDPPPALPRPTVICLTPVRNEVCHGARHFRRQAIWDADWAALAARYGCGPRERFLDSRSRRQRAVHAWLRLTQRSHHCRVVRWTEAWLRRRGW